MDASFLYVHKKSATHRVLESHNLSSMIFSLIDHWDADQSLARLARTCKMFFKPAIEILWDELCYFYPILHALPPGCWEWTNEWRHKAVLKRQFTRDECERLLIYTSKIRSFHDTVRIRSADISVYRHLSKLFQPHDLFPCLRKLKWNPEEDELFPYIKMFLGPQLNHLEIRFDDLTPAHKSIFPALGSCSTLQTVLLDAYEEKGIIPLSKVVMQWTHLRTLNIFAVSPEVFLHLASHPSLVNFKIGNVKNLHWDAIRSHIPSNPFPSLDAFEIESGWMKSTTQLLETVKFRVSTFRIIFEEASPGELWDTLFKSIHKSFDKNNLTEFVVKEYVGPWISEPARQRRRITANTLSCLFSFKNLTYIRIVSTCGYNFDDSFLRDLALSLPKIQTLVLLTGRVWEFGTPSIKLGALVQLSRHCQHLKVLGIEMVAEPEDLPEFSSCEPGSFICPLQRLDVANSPIKHPIRVAHLLSDWFPNLQEIWTEDPQSGEQFLTKRAPRWFKVSENLQGMTQVRRQERNSGSTFLDPDFDNLALLQDEDSVDGTESGSEESKDWEDDDSDEHGSEGESDEEFDFEDEPEDLDDEDDEE